MHSSSAHSNSLREHTPATAQRTPSWSFLFPPKSNCRELGESDVFVTQFSAIFPEVWRTFGWESLSEFDGTWLIAVCAVKPLFFVIQVTDFNSFCSLEFLRASVYSGFRDSRDRSPRVFTRQAQLAVDV